MQPETTFPIKSLLKEIFFVLSFSLLLCDGFITFKLISVTCLSVNTNKGTDEEYFFSRAVISLYVISILLLNQTSSWSENII